MDISDYFMAISDDVGTSQPIAILIAENQEMNAWDVQLMVGGSETEDRARRVADLLREILISDGFAARLDAIQ